MSCSPGVSTLLPTLYLHGFSDILCGKQKRHLVVWEMRSGQGSQTRRREWGKRHLNLSSLQGKVISYLTEMERFHLSFFTFLLQHWVGASAENNFCLKTFWHDLHVKNLCCCIPFKSHGVFKHYLCWQVRCQLLGQVPEPQWAVAQVILSHL